MVDSDNFATRVFRVLHRFRDSFESSLITGAAHILPSVITVLAIGTVLEFLVQLLHPVGTIIQALGNSVVSLPVLGGVLVILLLATTLGVGFLIEITNHERTTERVHSLFGAIPVIGPIYLIFRRMSESLFQNDMKSFCEVKLVEYPNEGTYTFGFVTDYSPTKVSEALHHDTVQTLFMPLAPNPVLGGRVIYVPEEYTYEIDMTVEEAIRTLITSGVVTETHNPSANRSTEQGPPANQTLCTQQNTEQ